FPAIDTLLARGICRKGSVRRCPPERVFTPLGHLRNWCLYRRVSARYQRDESGPIRYWGGRDALQNARRSAGVVGGLAHISRVLALATSGRHGSHANVTLDLGPSRPWTFASSLAKDC